MKKYICLHCLMVWGAIFALTSLCTLHVSAQKLQEPEAKAQIPVSRMVAVEEKQRLEIRYPGHGWVYIGEKTSQQGLKYEQRKLQEDASVFMFTAEKKGEYVLHFSYFDVFTNDFITDAVAVTVSTVRSPIAQSTVQAPEYQNGARSGSTVSSNKKPPLKAGQEEGTAKAENERTEPDTAEMEAKEIPSPIQQHESEPSIPPQMEEQDSIQSLTPDQLLEKARAAIGSADAESALTYLDRFFAVATQKLDEGLFLKGRTYELNSAIRNIGSALDAYKNLTDAFPQSKYWAEADTRIRYITNFYVTIQ